MTVQTIEHAGFCFGVSRAVELLEKEIEAGSKPLYTVGPIIHNPQIIDQMSQKGVQIVDDVRDLPLDSTAVIRAHGITKEDLAYLNEQGIRFIDATCPFVEKIHRIVDDEKENVIFIAGNPDHPEVMGIRSYGGNDTFVFKNLAELEELTEKNPSFSSKYIVVVWQTTFNLTEFEKCLSFLKKKSSLFLQISSKNLHFQC